MDFVRFLFPCNSGNRVTSITEQRNPYYPGLINIYDTHTEYPEDVAIKPFWENPTPAQESAPSPSADLLQTPRIIYNACHSPCGFLLNPLRWHIISRYLQTVPNSCILRNEPEPRILGETLIGNPRIRSLEFDQCFICKYYNSWALAVESLTLKYDSKKYDDMINAQYALLLARTMGYAYPVSSSESVRVLRDMGIEFPRRCDEKVFVVTPGYKKGARELYPYEEGHTPLES